MNDIGVTNAARLALHTYALTGSETATKACGSGKLKMICKKSLSTLSTTSMQSKHEKYHSLQIQIWPECSKDACAVTSKVKFLINYYIKLYS